MKFRNSGSEIQSTPSLLGLPGYPPLRVSESEQHRYSGGHGAFCSGTSGLGASRGQRGDVDKHLKRGRTRLGSPGSMILSTQKSTAFQGVFKGYTGTIRLCNIATTLGVQTVHIPSTWALGTGGLEVLNTILKHGYTTSSPIGETP